MNDGIKLSIFVVIIAVVAVIFVKPLNEHFTGLFPGESRKEGKIKFTDKIDSKRSNTSKNQTAEKSKIATSPAKKRDSPSGQKISYDIKKIQSLLRNAGFYKGKIDGKMGPQTIKAIKQFQRSKKLKENGVINVKTWEELKKYETGR